MKKVFLIFIALLMVSSACGKAPSQTSTPVPTQTAKPLPTPVSYKNPLTGLDTAKDISQNRPYAIMLNNLYEALPQHGVGSADIIYEVMAEGEISRMVAVFQDISSVGTIGSVRSTRSYYLDIAGGLDAILLHVGASTYAYDDIETRNAVHVDGIFNSTIFYRDENRARNAGYEHSLFSSSDLILDNISKFITQTKHKNGYVCGMKFGANSASSGKTAKEITVKYSYYKTGVFDYHSDDGLYYISQFDEPYTDGNTDKQVAVKNVLVLYANHSAINNDELSRIEVDLVGSGKGVYACNGNYIDITWTKDSYDSEFEYKLPSGSELVFEAGKSYINIVNTDNTAVIK